MSTELIALMVVCWSGSFAALGGIIATLKSRSPSEGFVLGSVLGPIGVAIEVGLPSVQRPPIDRPAWRSFRMLVAHQDDVQQNEVRMRPGTRDGRRVGS